MTSQKVLTRKIVLFQDGKCVFEFFDEIRENDEVYFNFKVGQLAQNFADIKSKPISVFITEECQIEPTGTSES
jgi:hypothetical protein